MEPEVREMLRINVEQRRYYEQANGAKESEINSFATKLYDLKNVTSSLRLSLMVRAKASSS